MDRNHVAGLREALADRLERELEVTLGLLAALLEEQQAVAGHDEQCIEDNAVRKEALVNSLQEATEARLTAMRQAGYDGDWPGIERCIAALDDESGRLKGLFGELNRLGRRCIHENRVVGQLINRRVQFIGKALGNISAGGADGLTYQASGKTEATGDQRSLGSV